MELINISENAYTNEDLKVMQKWDLNRKIQVAQTRIMEWYIKHDKKCYISFSGGKDSTVLADMAVKVCKMLDCKLVLWFSDTGLEFPEIRGHVKTFGKYLEDRYDIEVETIMEYPTDRKGKRVLFRDVILNEGYPIISKNVSQHIKGARNGSKSSMALLDGTYTTDGVHKSIFCCEKWKFLLDAPFKISNQCCSLMKKQPAHRFNKRSGLLPIVGTMAEESKQRKTNWLQYGCNVFDGKEPASRPMSVWTEQNVLEYLSRFSIPYPSVYGEIKQDDKGNYYTTGYNRTGCVFCAYGCHHEKEPNRFQMLKQTHPKLHEYCMKPVDEGGLGMKEVLDYINVKTE